MLTKDILASPSKIYGNLIITDGQILMTYSEGQNKMLHPIKAIDHRLIGLSMMRLGSHK